MVIKRRALAVTKVDLQLTKIYLAQELKKLGEKDETNQRTKVEA